VLGLCWFNGVLLCLFLGVRDHDHSHVGMITSHFTTAIIMTTTSKQHTLHGSRLMRLPLILGNSRLCLTAKYFGFIWMDRQFGNRWSCCLSAVVGRLITCLRAGYLLATRKGPHNLQAHNSGKASRPTMTQCSRICMYICGDWAKDSISAIISRRCHMKPLTPAQLQSMYPKNMGLVHVTVEVQLGACPRICRKVANSAG